MSTQHRLQQYLEKHKIHSLFEEMMNKVAHDQPPDPLIAMIKLLYKKTGLDIPQELRLGGVRRSSPERIARRPRSKSPDKGRVQGWTSSSPDPADRSYEKPWLSANKQRLKPKTSDEPEHTKQGRRQKPEWNADKKGTTASFDDLWQGKSKSTHAQPLSKSMATVHVDSRKGWASIGLEHDENMYSSSGYRGPQASREEDPLAGELKLSSGGNKSRNGEVTAAVVSSGHIRGPRLEAEKHRQELEKLLLESEKQSTDSGFVEEHDDIQDDAIELLEDAEELRREGVTKIPKTGFKLSRGLTQREEPQVKLNINLYTGSVPQGDSLESRYNSIPQYADDNSDHERPTTGLSGRRFSPGASDEEFESVSQVTGPRKPVWNTPDSEGESYVPKPQYSLPEPSRSFRQTKGIISESRNMAATLPVRFEEPRFHSQSMESADSFLQGGKSWAAGDNQSGISLIPDVRESYQSEEVRESLRSQEVRESLRSQEVRESLMSQDGAWNIPDDSDSAIDWNRGQSGGRRGPPRAY